MDIIERKVDRNACEKGWEKNEQICGILNQQQYNEYMRKHHA